MNFNELQRPIEAFDFRTYESVPKGRWQGGISQMLFAKYRVGLSLKATGFYTLNYWGGDQDTAIFLCGIVIGICFWLPEEISESELRNIFPTQENKELSAAFFEKLSKTSELARSRFLKLN